MGLTGFDWVLLGLTGFYRVLLGFTEFYRVWLGWRSLEWGVTGFYWVFLGFSEFYWFNRTNPRKWNTGQATIPKTSVNVNNPQKKNNNKRKKERKKEKNSRNGALKNDVGHGLSTWHTIKMEMLIRFHSTLSLSFFFFFSVFGVRV